MSKFALLAALAAFAVGTSVALKTAPVDTLKSARIRAKARLREALAQDDKVSNPDVIAAVDALLAWFDVVGFAQCVGFLWPDVGGTAFKTALQFRFRFKSASLAARAGLPRIGSTHQKRIPNKEFKKY